MPAVTLGALGRRLGGEGEGVSLAPVRVAPLSRGGSPKPTAGQKVCTGAGTGGGGGAQVQSRERGGLGSAPSPLSLLLGTPFSFVHLVLEMGGVPVGASPVPDSPPPGLLPGPQVEQPPAEPGGPAGEEV